MLGKMIAKARQCKADVDSHYRELSERFSCMGLVHRDDSAILLYAIYLGWFRTTSPGPTQQTSINIREF
jgi:hypothetical protein